MPPCPHCDGTFDTEHDLHLHLREHWEELSSHDREEVKAAEREAERRERERQERIARRRKRLGYGLAAVLALGLVAVVTAQTVDITASNPAGGDATSPVNLSDQPVLGDPDAPVTITVFEDYRCPYCRQFEQTVKPRIVDEFVDTGRARLYFVNFPFLGPGSTRAAIAAECVHDRDRDGFWRFNDALFDAQGPENERWVTTDLLTRLAADHTDADPDAVRACITGETTRTAVQRDRRLGDSFGVSSTPSVYVNGEYVEDWRFSNLRRVIERHE